MKKTFPSKSVLICFALTLLFTCCEDEWFKKDATMGYIIQIETAADGSCIYLPAPKPDDKTSTFSFPGDCGHYKIGEGIFVAK